VEAVSVSFELSKTGLYQNGSKPRKIKVFRGFSMPEQLTTLEEKLSGNIERTLAIRRSSGYARLLQLVQKKSAPIKEIQTFQGLYRYNIL